MRTTRIGCAVALALCLTGCKGAGSGDNAGDPLAASGCIGSFIGGSSNYSNNVCTVCSTAAHPRDAYDGNRETSADYAFGSGSDAHIGVRAQSGVVFPAGNFAGALMAIPPEYTGTTWAIATYLDGLPQEALTPANSSGGDMATPSGTDEYYGFTTSQPFDEVRITMNGGAAAVEPPAIRIYEFCSQR